MTAWFELVSKAAYPLVLQAATPIFPMDGKFYSTGQTAEGEDKSELVKPGNSFASTQHVSGYWSFHRNAAWARR